MLLPKHRRSPENFEWSRVRLTVGAERSSVPPLSVYSSVVERSIAAIDLFFFNFCDLRPGCETRISRPNAVDHQESKLQAPGRILPGVSLEVRHGTVQSRVAKASKERVYEIDCPADRPPSDWNIEIVGKHLKSLSRAVVGGSQFVLCAVIKKKKKA